MPAMKGIDEVEAAELTVGFLKEISEKLNAYHSRCWGISHPYFFRERVADFKRLLDTRGNRSPPTPPQLTDVFLLEVRRRWTWEWDTFASFALHRADWDDTPEMRGAVCVLSHKHLTPPFFYSETREFIRNVFGCERVEYFTDAQVEKFIKRY